MLSFERPAYRVGPWLECGNLDLGRVPITPRPNKSVSLCLNCLYKQYGLC